MSTPPVAADDLEIRRAGPSDQAAILALAARALGWDHPETDAELFRWKHLRNPFGPSPMWVAVIDDDVVGFRAFLRWEFEQSGRDIQTAVRAVDTATDPAAQGRGIFTSLTLGAIDELRVEHADFVFNTPNDSSRPGYLKMGWHVVGRLPVSVRPAHAGALGSLARARQPASRSVVAVNVGDRAADAFSDASALEGVLDAVAPRPGLATRTSVEYFRWRYGLDDLHYRVVTPPGGVEHGFAAFRLRRRGRALEAVIADVVVPRGAGDRSKELLQVIARTTGADYLVRIDGTPVGSQGFFWVPRAGPILTARAIATPPPELLDEWRLGMGEIELF